MNETDHTTVQAGRDHKARDVIKKIIIHVSGHYVYITNEVTGAGGWDKSWCLGRALLTRWF